MPYWCTWRTGSTTTFQDEQIDDMIWTCSQLAQMSWTCSVVPAVTELNRLKRGSVGESEGWFNIYEQDFYKTPRPLIMTGFALRVAALNQLSGRPPGQTSWGGFLHFACVSLLMAVCLGLYRWLHSIVFLRTIQLPALATVATRGRVI